MHTGDASHLCLEDPLLMAFREPLLKLWTATGNPDPIAHFSQLDGLKDPAAVAALAEAMLSAHLVLTNIIQYASS
jgi:hypothetical protein